MNTDELSCAVQTLVCSSNDAWTHHRPHNSLLNMSQIIEPQYMGEPTDVDEWTETFNSVMDYYLPRMELNDSVLATQPVISFYFMHAISRTTTNYMSTKELRAFKSNGLAAWCAQFQPNDEFVFYVVDRGILFDDTRCVGYTGLCEYVDELFPSNRVRMNPKSVFASR